MRISLSLYIIQVFTNFARPTGILYSDSDSNLLSNRTLGILIRSPSFNMLCCVHFFPLIFMKPFLINLHKKNSEKMENSF